MLINNANITGSLAVVGTTVLSGSLAVSTFSGSGVRYLVADAAGNMTAQTASAAIRYSQTYTASAGQTTFAVTNGYTTGLIDVYLNGTKLLDGPEYLDTSGTNIVLTTGSFAGDIVEVVTYQPASGVTNNSLRQLTSFTATEGQTTFSASYVPGLLDVFYNGSRLNTIEYTAANGNSITLATSSAAGDLVDVLVYSYQVGAFSGIGGAGTANQIAYWNTTNSITGSPNFTVSGSTLVVTGSFTVLTGSAAEFAVNPTGVNIGNAITDTHAITGSVNISGSLTINGGSQTINTNNQQALLITSSNSTGFYTSYQSGSTLFGDIGNGSQVYNGGDVTAFGINARGNRKLQLGVNQASVVTISGSFVGINNPSPIALLDIYTGSIGAYFRGGSDNIGRQLKLSSATTTNAGDTHIIDAQSGTGVLVFAVTSTERMRINANGVVSIATTGSGFGNPSLLVQAKSGVAIPLQVISDSSGRLSNFYNSDFNASNTGTNVRMGFTAGSGNTSFQMQVYTAGETTSGDLVLQPSYGNLLVGTTSSPSAYGKLIVRGTNQGLTIQDASTNGYRSLYLQSGNLYFYNGTNEGYLSTGGTWVNASDITLKKDIKDIEYGLNEVMQLKPKWYKMIDDDLEQIGFIAQDVEEVLPELVSTSEKGMKGLSYGQLTAVLTKALQEANAKITVLEEKLERNNIQ